MPYDPRMLQMAQMGVRMMGPQASPFDRTNQPKQWWDQPLPQSQQRNDDNPSGQPANQPAAAPRGLKRPASAVCTVGSKCLTIRNLEIFLIPGGLDPFDNARMGI